MSHFVINSDADDKGFEEEKSVTTDLLILTYGSSSKPSRESLICNRLRKDRKQNCNNNMPKYIIWTTVRTWSIAWPMFRCTCTVWHQNKILLALELNRCGHTEKQYRIVSILLVFDFCQSQNKPNTRAYMGWCKRGEWSGLPQPRARTHTKKIPRKKNLDPHLNHLNTCIQNMAADEDVVHYELLR